MKIILICFYFLLLVNLNCNNNNKNFPNIPTNNNDTLENTDTIENTNTNTNTIENESKTVAICRTIRYKKPYVDSLKNNVIKKGDTISYDLLVNYYFFGNGSEELSDFLRISKKMADVYEYPVAYYWMYQSILTVKGNENFSNLSDKEKKECLYYIKKSINSGNSAAVSDYEEYTGKSKKKKDIYTILKNK